MQKPGALCTQRAAGGTRAGFQSSCSPGERSSGASRAREPWGACLVSPYLPSFLLPFQFTLGAGEKQIRTDPHLVLQIPPSRAPVNPGVSSSHSRHQAEGTTPGQPRPNRPDRIPPSLTYCRSSPRSGIKSSVIFVCVLTRAVSLACWERRQRSPASVLGNRH